MIISVRRVALCCSILLLAFSYINVVDILVDDISLGGDSYCQGDWLVNFAGGLVRRGGLGEFVLCISDIFDISPLYVVGFFQLSFMTLVYVSVVAIFYLMRYMKYVFSIFMLPTFVLFWFYEGNSYYKEVIGMAAFAPLLVAAAIKYSASEKVLSPHLIVGAFASSIALFVIAVVGSEINVFFFPFLAFVAFSVFHFKSAVAYAVFTGVCAIASVLFALKFPSIPSADAVCNVLLMRGLNDEICSGSIAWLEKDSRDGIMAVLSMATPAHLARTFSSIFLSLFMIYFVLRVNNWRRVAAIALCFGFFAFLPLYVVAVDWGRWINMGIFSILSVASIISARFYRDNPAGGHARVAGERWQIIVLLLVFCSVWAITNRGTLMVGGALAFKFL